MAGEQFFPWGDSRRLNSYSGYCRRLFGTRVQKIPVDAGFTCPNRDGTLGRTGCTFCRNDAFTPAYCDAAKSVARQIGEGAAFHARRSRGSAVLLAYFQAYSNTYAPLDRLRACYSEALACPGVAGLIVGTRPDCVDGEKLDYFASLARDRYVMIEYGVESTCDATLRAVNRGHDYATARQAIETTAARGIHTGAHFILGLPGESREMLLRQVDRINRLPLDTVKFHQLQIFRDTPLAAEYAAHPERFSFPTVDEYLDLLAEIVRRLRPEIAVERIAGETPARYRCRDGWQGVRHGTLTSLLEKRLAALGAYQGEKFLPLQP